MHCRRHLESRTYRIHYQDQNIALDVANLVRGQDTDDAMLRRLNSMGANRHLNANLSEQSIGVSARLPSPMHPSRSGQRPSESNGLRSSFTGHKYKRSSVRSNLWRKKIF